VRNSGWIEAKSSHGSSVTEELISMVVRQLYIHHSCPLVVMGWAWIRLVIHDGSCSHAPWLTNRLLRS